MNIGIFITVRTGSSRLPSKALMKIADEPVITHLINRIKKANKQITNIFVCTTTLPTDEELCLIAEKCGAFWYRGDPENIIRRHYECAVEKNIDFIVNVDGDDVLCNPEYIDLIIKKINADESFDIIKTVGLPFGTNSMAYKKSVLKKILDFYKDSSIDTGWGKLLQDRSLFNIYEIPAKKEDMLEARMTLDYQEDFEFFKKVIENTFEKNGYTSQSEIINFLKCNPEVIQINSHLNDEYWNNFYSKSIKKRGVTENGE